MRVHSRTGCGGRSADLNITFVVRGFRLQSHGRLVLAPSSFSSDSGLFRNPMAGCFTPLPHWAVLVSRRFHRRPAREPSHQRRCHCPLTSSMGWRGRDVEGRHGRRRARPLLHGSLTDQRCRRLSDCRVVVVPSSCYRGVARRLLRVLLLLCCCPSGLPLARCSQTTLEASVEFRGPPRNRLEGPRGGHQGRHHVVAPGLFSVRHLLRQKAAWAHRGYQVFITIVS